MGFNSPFRRLEFMQTVSLQSKTKRSDRYGYLFLPEDFSNADREWIKKALDVILTVEEGYSPEPTETKEK